MHLQIVTIEFHNQRAMVGQDALALLPLDEQKKIAHSVSSRIALRDPCCVCGREHSRTHRVHAHHEDYTKPFEVVFLCHRCHVARHVELGTYMHGKLRKPKAAVVTRERVPRPRPRRGPTLAQRRAQKRAVIEAQIASGMSAGQRRIQRALIKIAAAKKGASK
jgi:hypothetical protein